MLPSDRVVFLDLDFPLDRLLVLTRIVSMTLAEACFVPYGDEFDEM